MLIELREIILQREQRLSTLGPGSELPGRQIELNVHVCERWERLGGKEEREGKGERKGEGGRGKGGGGERESLRTRNNFVGIKRLRKGIN